MLKDYKISTVYIILYQMGSIHLNLGPKSVYTLHYHYQL
nr:MAG TPA: hypothetical protein [Bacteriophage sp.]